TQNWTSVAPTNPNLFFNGDNVTFGDAASNTDIALGSTLTPGNMTFNNATLDYSISGGGSLAGTGILTKNGTAALTIATNNSYSGGVMMNAGTLNVNNNGALGSGPLTISGGVLGNTSGAAVTVSSNPQQTWNADVVFNGPNSLNLGTGNVQWNLPGGASRTV